MHKGRRFVETSVMRSILAAPPTDWSRTLTNSNKWSSEGRNLNDEILLNESEASLATDSIPDPVTRNFVRFGLAEARSRALKVVPHDEIRWRAGLPAAPFDMLYFQSVLRSLFEQRDVVTALLAGSSLAAAAGWDDSGIGNDQS